MPRNNTVILTATASATAKTVRDYVEELKRAVKSHGDTYREIGLILIEARDQLSREEYDTLEQFLIGTGFTRGKVQACVAAAEGSFNPDLLFYYEKNTRMARLTKKDQERLASDPLPVKQPDGSIENLRWSQCNAAQRFQLLGRSCDRILPPEDQVVKATGEVNRVYEDFTFDPKTDFVTVSVGKKRGKFRVRDFADSLVSKGQAKAVLARLTRLVNAMEIDDGEDAVCLQHGTD
jgi:hypothetical protein